jgi:lipopolysaccharide export system protein LptA
MTKFFIKSLFISSLFFTGIVYALPSDREQPIQINADSARYNEKTGIAVYTGQVVIQQGTLEIRADEIVIRVDKKGGISSLTATGKPARFQQKTDPQKGIVSAESSQVDYDVKNEIITLAGAAKLQQDGASFKGNTITYNSQTQQVEAKGDSQNRVQLTLPPSAQGKPRPTKESSK